MKQKFSFLKAIFLGNILLLSLSSAGNSAFAAGEETSPSKVEPVKAQSTNSVAEIQALADAGKYSEAENITISISSEDSTIHFKIEDDGIGFDLSTTKKGYGLKNMKKRTEDLEGSLCINTSSNGTLISVVLPN